MSAPLDTLWPGGPAGMIAVRTRNALLREGHRTAADVAAETADGLLAVYNIGPVQLAEVRRVLAAARLSLAGEEPRP